MGVNLVGIGIGLLLMAGFTGSAEAREKIVLVSHGGMANPFWSVVFNGAKEAAKNMGVDLQILFPNRDGDQPGTTQKLSEAISTHPQGIAVTLASAGHCEYIREARKKNIPIIAFNARAVAPSANCPYEAYIGMDEYQAGIELAEKAWKTGKIRDRAMVGLTEPGHSGLQARAKGISDSLKKKKVQVDVLDIGNDPSGVPARIHGYLSAHKKDVSGLFIPAPNGMHPLLRMMEENSPEFQKKYVGAFDLTPLILKGIKDERIDHSIDQQPYLQGYFAVSQLVLASRGKFAPVDMNTGVGVVDKTNMSSIAELVKNNIR